MTQRTADDISTRPPAIKSAQDSAEQHQSNDMRFPFRHGWNAVVSYVSRLAATEEPELPVHRYERELHRASIKAGLLEQNLTATHLGTQLIEAAKRGDERKLKEILREVIDNEDDFQRLIKKIVEWKSEFRWTEFLQMMGVWFGARTKGVRQTYARQIRSWLEPARIMVRGGPWWKIGDIPPRTRAFIEGRDVANVLVVNGKPWFPDETPPLRALDHRLHELELLVADLILHDHPIPGAKGRELASYLREAPTPERLSVDAAWSALSRLLSLEIEALAENPSKERAQLVKETLFRLRRQSAPG